MKTTKKKLDFWGKFQKRLKSERSRKLKWRFSKKKSSAKEEEDDDDMIAEANEERETTIDSLLHVLEECLTSSIVPGEGGEDLDNEIDTLSNAVLKLKQEMEGIETEDNLLSIIQENVDLEFMDDDDSFESLPNSIHSPKFKRAIDVLDDIHREVLEASKDDAFSDNGTAFFSIERQSTLDIDEFYSTIDPSEMARLNALEASRQNEERLRAENEVYRQARWKAVKEHQKAAEERKVLKAKESAEREARLKAEKEQDQKINHYVVPFSTNKEFNPNVDVKTDFAVSKAKAKAKTLTKKWEQDEIRRKEEKERMQEASKLETAHLMSTMLDQFERGDENLPLDEGTSSSKSKGVSWGDVSNLLEELDSKRKEVTDTKQDSSDTLNEQKENKRDDSKSLDIMSMPSSKDPCTDSIKAKNPIKKRTPKAVKQVYASMKAYKEREQEKKNRMRRFISYKDDMALAEEKMKRERPKFSIAEEATLASRVIKYFRARLVQQAKEEPGPWMEPYPFKTSNEEDELSFKSTNLAPLSITSANP